MIIVFFFNSKSVFKVEQAPTGKNVNAEYYLNIQWITRERIRKKCPENCGLRRINWLLHQDNAPTSHRTNLVQDLKKNHVKLTDYAPYSPNLAPVDFFTFPQFKFIFKGEHWQSVEVVKKELAAILNTISFEKQQQRFTDQQV